MHLNKIVISAFLFIIFLLPSLNGQETLYDLNSNYDGQNVMIKWFPYEFKDLQRGLDHGYIVNRYTHKLSGSTLSDSSRIASKVTLANPMLPVSEASWPSISADQDIKDASAKLIFDHQVDTLDGGSNLQTAVKRIKHENEVIFGLDIISAQSFVISEAMGLALIDTTVISNSLYFYEIFAIGTNDTTFIGGLLANTSGVGTADQNIVLSGIPSDSSILLNWDILGNTDISFLHIQKRTAGTGSFANVNSAPILNSGDPNLWFYIDSLTNNLDSFDYRMYGITSMGLSTDYSDTITISGRPAPLGVTPSIDSIVENQDGSLTILFDFPDSLNNKLAQDWILYRAAKMHGNFDSLLSISKTIRTTTDASPLSSNYYILQNVDINGHPISSLPVLHQMTDTIPPQVPQNLTCTCDRNGKVTLKWDHSPDTDIQGYRVFRSSQSGLDYEQLTSTVHGYNQYEAFITLDNLSKYEYFKIRAVDKRENESLFTAACEVERPDIIPPAPPLLYQAYPGLNGVIIKWVPSYSADVEMHEIQRSELGIGNWTTISSFNTKQLFDGLTDPSLDTIDRATEYLDTLLEKQTFVQYRVLAFDHAGNMSSSKEVTSKVLDVGERGIVNFLHINVNYEDSISLSLFWQYDWPDLEEHLHDFLIYRAGEKQPMVSYKTIRYRELLQGAYDSEMTSILANGTFHFKDDNLLDRSTKYTYRIIARHKDGGKSGLSNAVKVSY